MDLALKGKNAIVTGGSKGIGKAIALALAAEGVNVATCARQEEPLLEVEQALLDRGVTTYVQTCHVGDHEELENFLEAAKEQFGTIDILVNNVSAMAVSDDVKAWDACFNVDIMATVKASEKVAGWMGESHGGSILNISSISGLESTPTDDYAYAALKAALISYTQKLAFNLAPGKIRVNALAPGSIEFEGSLWSQVRERDPNLYQTVVNTIPWGRMGTPEEVAAAAVFLCSERASWITGVCLIVDGGQHRGNR